jgi:hypothetical protein
LIILIQYLFSLLFYQILINDSSVLDINIIVHVFAFVKLIDKKKD